MENSGKDFETISVNLEIPKGMYEYIENKLLDIWGSIQDFVIFCIREEMIRRKR